MKNFILILSILLSLSSTAFAAKLKVITTLPDLAEVVRKVGGEEVEVDSLLSGKEDPHFADAVPDFIRKVANADVVCQMGLDLEVGWFPKVLSRSANAAVQSGGKGFCVAGKSVTVVDKPTGPVDRSMGDVHPQGNPHFNLSPKALAESSRTIADVLSAVRPEKASAFSANQKAFEKEMDQLLAKMRAQLKPVLDAAKDKKVAMEYHKQFSYFFNVYGISSAGSIEDKPGVPPSAARLAEVANLAKAAGVKVAFAASYSPDKQLERFSELSGIKVRKLPTAVQKSGAADSIEKVQQALVQALIQSST